MPAPAVVKTPSLRCGFAALHVVFIENRFRHYVRRSAVQARIVIHIKPNGCNHARTDIGAAPTADPAQKFPRPIQKSLCFIGGRLPDQTIFRVDDFPLRLVFGMADLPQIICGANLLEIEGAGYQRRINAVLRSYMQQKKAKKRKRA